jgi:large conductance mechanosensitive channel
MLISQFGDFKYMNKFFEDFKAFIMKGNVIDLAVAVIIGGAFQPVISSMVNDIIMPPIGMAVGGVDFTDLSFIIQSAVNDQAEIAIRYGNFIQKIVDFVIIGFCVFLVVKLSSQMQNLRKKEEASPETPEVAPEASNEEKLLAEIRDLLKTK